MKTNIKTIAIVALCSAIAFTANANDNGLPSRWSVGISAGGNVGPGDNITKQSMPYYTTNARFDPMKGWDIGVEGAYRLPMSSKFLFHPSLSLAYRYYGDIKEKLFFDGPSPAPSVAKGYGEMNEFRTDLTLPVGFIVPFKHTVLEFETGPRFGWYLYQKLKDIDCDLNSERKFVRTWLYSSNLYRRFSAQWRFSATCNFLSNRLYAKVAFDLTMSHPVSGVRGRNVLSGGVGVNF